MDKETDITLGDLMILNSELLQVTKSNKKAADLFQKVSICRVNWYSFLYDKEIKQLEDSLEQALSEHTCLMEQLEAECKETAANPLKKQSVITRVAMLGVSGHLYAEAGRMLQKYRKLSLLKFFGTASFLLVLVYAMLHLVFFG